MPFEQRKNSRIKVSGDFYYYPNRKKKKIKCKLDNISVTGACITTDEKIEKEDIIYLQINGFNNKALKSKAVWKIDNQYGIQFFLDSNNEFETISHVMNNIMNKNGQ
ncbi:MAG: PilZ domain-containing protein [Spirochaetota bacterium]